MLTIPDFFEGLLEPVLSIQTYYRIAVQDNRLCTDGLRPSY